MGLVEFEKDGKNYRVSAKVLSSAKELKALANETNWEILKELSKKPMYPAELSKKLNLHEQKVYYSIKQLKKAELIELVKTEEKQGALAKYYEAKYSAFAAVPGNQYTESKSIAGSVKRKELPEKVKEFLEPLIADGKFNAKIVVGSPDPHGIYKARARDNHLAAELGAYLSTLCNEIDFPLIFLDTQFKSLESENSNLIIVGGPVTNKLSKELNNSLPIKFVQEGGHWAIESTLSKQRYVEDEIGIIQKIPHPKFKNKSILLIAGNRNNGTKAAILAFSKKLEELTKPNKFNEKFHAHIVEGLDVDGDGFVDDVEIKE